MAILNKSITKERARRQPLPFVFISERDNTMWLFWVVPSLGILAELVEQVVKIDLLGVGLA